MMHWLGQDDVVISLSRGSVVEHGLGPVIPTVIKLALHQIPQLIAFY